MKDKSSSVKIVLTVILFVLLLLSVIRITKNFEDKLTVIDASLVTVEEKYTCDAVFIRSESVIHGRGGGAEYLVRNGEKVSANQNICIFFDSPSASSLYDELSQLNENISSLKYIDSMVVGATDTAKLDRVIYDQLKLLSDNAYEGSAVKTDKSFFTLNELTEARYLGIYDSSSTDYKISALEKEADSLKARLERSSDVIRTPKSGYFMNQADGYENIFTPSVIPSLDSAELSSRLNRRENVPSDAVGTLINDFSWYFATEADKEHTALFTRVKDSGIKLNVYFPNVSSSPVECSVYRINRGDDISVIVFKCSVMSAEFLSERAQTAEIVLDTVSGIKVPREALHQRDGEWGVYCLEGSDFKFKKADILFQTESYYLLKPAASSSKGLFLYDKIITGGIGME